MLGYSLCRHKCRQTLCRPQHYTVTVFDQRNLKRGTRSLFDHRVMGDHFDGHAWRVSYCISGFGTICANYRCHVFTTGKPKCVRALSPCQKGNTHAKLARWGEGQA